MRGAIIGLVQCLAGCGAAFYLSASAPAAPAGEPVADLQKEFRLLRQQNEQLHQQLQRQEETIQQLQKKVLQLQESSQQQKRELSTLPEGTEKPTLQPSAFLQPFKSGNLVLGGQGGLAFFHQGSQGQFRNAEFRVDDAKLSLEAKVWEDVYLYNELNLLLREGTNEDLSIGELYLDFENISRLWNQERQLNLRAGRFYIPFGEEYQMRNVIDNPLIMHSLSDLWGVDEGVELYGAAGKFQYAMAVQNGGQPLLRDYDADKAVVGRLGYDPARWLHVSGSAMRTGRLDVKGDKFSELWFGNGFFRALGISPLTSKFQADLFEGDVQFRLPHGQLKSAGGYVFFDDNDPTTNNRRNLYYYYVEGVHDLTGKLYAASRFSQILAPRGYPLVGNGNFGHYFFNNAEQTTDLWRLSLGLGYRWNQNFVLKVEYCISQGRELNGDSRNNEDFLGLEIGYRF